MIFNDKPGFLDKDDVIKSMAAEIEMLRAELRASNHMKFTYMEDSHKMLAEIIRLRGHLHEQAQKMHGKYATWHDPKDKWGPCC